MAKHEVGRAKEMAEHEVRRAKEKAAYDVGQATELAEYRMKKAEGYRKQADEALAEARALRTAEVEVEKKRRFEEVEGWLHAEKLAKEVSELKKQLATATLGAPLSPPLLSVSSTD